MVKLKIYDIVKDLLIKEPLLRSSDRKLIWRVWETTGFASEEEWGEKTYLHASIIYRDFMKAPMCESITRARRKVQEDNPSLRATDLVQRAREEKEQTKGLFTYHETIEK
jgi:hypothetical protein